MMIQILIFTFCILDGLVYLALLIQMLSFDNYMIKFIQWQMMSLGNLTLDIYLYNGYIMVLVIEAGFILM